VQVESKREEFRRYLEGAGVLDALTKGVLLYGSSTIVIFMLHCFEVLVGLYEEPDKPKDPLEYPLTVAQLLFGKFVGVAS